MWFIARQSTLAGASLVAVLLVILTTTQNIPAGLLLLSWISCLGPAALTLSVCDLLGRDHPAWVVVNLLGIGMRAGAAVFAAVLMTLGVVGAAAWRDSLLMALASIYVIVLAMETILLLTDFPRGLDRSEV